MNTAIKEIDDSIYGNSIFFLKEAIKSLTKHEDITATPLSRETLLLSCLFIQFSLELGMKAYIIRKASVKDILKLEHKDDGEAELLERFKNNQIQTKPFWQLKNFIKKRYHFREETFALIDKFQNIRNNIVHINYNFNQINSSSLKCDLIQVITHVIIEFLTDENLKASEFYEVHLDKNDFQKLIDFPSYVKKMHDLACEGSEHVYKCVICEQRTFASSENYCYACNYKTDDHGFLNCKLCDGKDSFIYDKLNIHSQDTHTINGMCLNCGESLFIFECPNCECAYIADFEYELDVCTQKKCINS